MKEFNQEQQDAIQMIGTVLSKAFPDRVLALIIPLEPQGEDGDFAIVSNTDTPTEVIREWLIDLLESGSHDHTSEMPRSN